ncbi:MAG: bifunctional folylpolyglutamate synthase/dihydrofolate synthase [Treponema sp.]
MNFEKKPDKNLFSLDTMRRYAAYFAQPQCTYKTIHSAGSKGKGSTSIMMASLLHALGYKTGLYTSPHVNDFRERITECGRFFADGVYERAYAAVQKGVSALVTDEAAQKPTWFELVTLTAFVLFNQEKLDWAVFETGMGGRLDATNVLRPEACLLTRIELEHCAYLGDTIPKIAAEKAGIIKRGVPVFCAAQQPGALAVFTQKAADTDSPFFYVPDALKSMHTAVSAKGLDLVLEFSQSHAIGALFSRPIHTVLPFFTLVQAENALLAVCAFKYLYPEAPESLIEAALQKAWLPARFQVIRFDPLIVFDGAHTLSSIQNAVDTFFQLTCAQAVLVFACAADKDPGAFAPVFLGKVSDIMLTIPGDFKKGDLPRVHEAFTAAFKQEKDVLITASEDFSAVLTGAFQKSIREKRPLLVIGSFYLAAEAQRIYMHSGFQEAER